MGDKSVDIWNDFKFQQLESLMGYFEARALHMVTDKLKSKDELPELIDFETVPGNRFPRPFQVGMHLLRFHEVAELDKFHTQQRHDTHLAK